MRRPVSLTPEEMIRLLAAARGRRLRDFVMILVTYTHGLRASETLQICAGDVADGYLEVSRGKGSEATLQPLQEHSNPLLNEVLAFEQWFAMGKQLGRKRGAKTTLVSPGGHSEGSKILHSMQNVKFPGADRWDPDDRLFPITRQRFWQLVRRYAAEAGIARGARYYTKRKPHALKHTCAKHLVNGGRPISEVQLWLGWKDIRTAAKYLLPEMDEVAAGVGKVFREQPAFRKEVQQFLFADSIEKARVN